MKPVIHFFSFGCYSVQTPCNRYIRGIDSKYITGAKNHVTCATCRKALGLKPRIAKEKAA